jgi:hypothetical protein
MEISLAIRRPEGVKVSTSNLVAAGPHAHNGLFVRDVLRENG